MKHHITVEEFANDIDKFLEQLNNTDDELILLKDGVPTAVVMSATAYDFYQTKISQLRRELKIDE